MALQKTKLKGNSLPRVAKIASTARRLTRVPNPALKRYSRLIRSLSQEDTKVVLSLGGGGIRMFAHVSILKFLEGIGAQQYISEVWGASGGAIMGLLYSWGIKPDQILEEAKKIFSKHSKVQLVPSIFSVVKNILLETLFSNNNEANVKGFHNIQEEMQNFIGEVLKGGKEKHPFYCLGYNTGTNQTDVFTTQKAASDLYPNFIYQVDPLEAVIASSSVPILFVPKTIEDQFGKRLYVDGATGEEVPTVSVYKKWLRDKELGIETRKRLLVISVDLHPDLSSLGFLENWLIRRIPAFQYILMTINLTDLIRKARIKDQKHVLSNDPNVELWELDFNLSGGGLMNANLIPRVLQVAEENFPKQFAQINDSLLA